MKVYIAGPMTGVADFNFPLFDKVTDELRAQGWEVVSPAEEDRKRGITHNAEGDATKLNRTWGQILAYDVELIADGGIEGIVFLPNWADSKGARLEAFVGLQSKVPFKFFYYMGNGQVVPVNPQDILAWVFRGSRDFLVNPK